MMPCLLDFGCSSRTFTSHTYSVTATHMNDKWRSGFEFDAYVRLPFQRCSKWGRNSTLFSIIL